ncbi:MAG: hypothetical protein WC471_02970 [Candidatus Woesearchaeota archaeon]
MAKRIVSAQMFFDWMKKMRENKNFAACHLPVLATKNQNGTPNLAVKGICIYSHADGQDYLLGIEFTEGNTYKNLCRFGYCALLFTDLETNQSYQVDCYATECHKGSTPYDYAVSKHNGFHGKARKVVCCYLFEVREVIDKSPGKSKK